MKLLRVIIVLNFFLVSSLINWVQAQDPVLIFQGKVSDMSSKKLEGVKVVIKKDGSIFKTETTFSNGKYEEMQCEFGHIYELTFSKQGYVSKTLVLDTKKGFYADEVEKKTFIEPSVTLFKKQPDVDYSIVTSRPVGKARIDPSSSKLDWDYTYLGQRKKEIDNFLKQVANKSRQQEELFKKMVSEGNALVAKRNYSVAILKYKEALKIKDDESVKQKIKDAENNLALLEEEKKKDAEFDNLIQKGDNLLISNKFDEAIAIYNQAKEIKPGDQIPYNKIKEANKKKDDLANAEINKQYQQKMSEAKKAYDLKDWTNAKKLYSEASTIKPSERDPKDRIIQIDGIIAKQQSDEQNYNNLITEADQALTAKDYDLSIGKYNNALRIKPTEQYPKEQIAKAKKLKEEALQQAMVDKQYQDKIDNADRQFERMDLLAAKSTYKEALAIKAEETYPKEKINEIDAKIKELEEQKKQQEEIRSQYNELIIKADGLYYSEELEEAKGVYTEAKELLPEEIYPQQKLDEINSKLQRIAQEAAAKKQRYDDLIAKADMSFTNNRWEEAKRDYKNALTIFSEETYPKEKLEAIKEKISEELEAAKAEDAKEEEFNKLVLDGDKQFSVNEFQAAKDIYLEAKEIYPDNPIIKQKLSRVEQKLKTQSELEELQAKYNELIKSADEARDAKKWDESKDLYQSALNTIPTEVYPQKQIDAINAKIKEENKNALQEQYLALIKEADEFFTQEDYVQALSIFNKAKDLKPTEAYPLEKIREIRRINSQNEDMERQYNATIAIADNEYESEKWDKALLSYQKALGIFKREYPENRIAEIQQKLEELKLTEASNQNKRKEYDDLISKADREFDENDYSTSKSTYQSALNLFSEEYYPKQRIAEIDVKLKNLESINEKKTKYDALIVKADAARDSKKWNDSKQFYRDANNIDASQSYPQEQIDWINEQMKKETEDEFKVQYDKLISAADDQFNSKNYEKAKELFIRAKNMNPEDSYPSQKIGEIERAIKEIQDEKLSEDKIKAQLDKYNKLISQADAARDSEQWNKAKNYYKQAYESKQDETYPQEQIDWINNKMKELADVEVEKQYQKIIEVADKMFADKNYNKSLELYRRAKVIKPFDPYPPKQIGIVEEAKLNALDDEKLTNSFNNLVKAGNSAFEQKKYRLALKRFSDALDLRSDAPYPANKIKEINEILDRIQANKSSNVNKDLSDNIVDNYKILYGEEVTGKYNENEIDQIIHRVRIDEDDERQRIISQRKDDVITDNANEIDYQINQSEERHYEMDLLNTERSKDQLDSDKNRLKIIPQVDHFKDSESNTMDLRSEHNTQITYENSERTEDLISTISNKVMERDIPRQEKVPETDQYKDELSDIEVSRVEGGNELSYDNYSANVKFETDQSYKDLDRDIPRQNSASKVDLYKDDISLTEEVIIDHYKVITYSNYDNKEALDSRISEFAKDADIPRQENVPEVDYYKDGVLVKDGELENYAQNVTFSNYDNKEELDSRISEFAKDADIPRQELVPQLDRYMDKESDVGGIWSETNVDKTFNVYSENEMLDNERYSGHVEKDFNREMNASEVEAYLDNLADKESDAYNSDIHDDYKINTELDEIKSTKATDGTDKYMQKLAVEYPEGITEKMFERKNSRGDVIEVTILRIVVRGNKGDEYRKVTSKWGMYYFKNGAVISEYIWDSETN